MSIKPSISTFAVFFDVRFFETSASTLHGRRLASVSYTPNAEAQKFSACTANIWTYFDLLHSRLPHSRVWANHHPFLVSSSTTADVSHRITNKTDFSSSLSCHCIVSMLAIYPWFLCLGHRHLLDLCYGQGYLVRADTPYCARYCARFCY